MQFRNCTGRVKGAERVGKQAKFQRLLPHKSQLIIFMATPGREPTPPTEATSRRLGPLVFPAPGIIKNYGLRFGSLETKQKQPKNRILCAPLTRPRTPPPPHPFSFHPAPPHPASQCTVNPRKKEGPAPLQGPKRWRRAAYKIDQWSPRRLNYDAICHHISSLQLKGRKGSGRAGCAGSGGVVASWCSLFAMHISHFVKPFVHCARPQCNCIATLSEKCVK